MVSNKQCPYRSQEHECKSGYNGADACMICMHGQIADSMNLVSSAIMEKSIDALDTHIVSPFCDGCKRNPCSLQTEKENLIEGLAITSCSEWTKDEI